jgi:SAM-dependent methyltransferase
LNPRLITTLTQVRSFLPRRLGNRIRRAAWHRYWQAEYEREVAKFGTAVPELEGSERALLIESIIDQYPFQSLLEVGCAYGQNFTVLGDFLDGISLTGVDKDPVCVREGQRILREHNVENAQLHEGDVTALRAFTDRSFDVVVCSAVLLYIGPEAINSAASELCRVTKSKLILLEQHVPGANPNNDWKGIWEPRPERRDGYWLRDYASLFERHVSREKIKINHVEHPIWTAEQWRSFACVIEIDLRAKDG